MNELLNADVLNADVLSRVVYLVVPGYIALRIYDLLVAAAPRRFSESLIELTAISLINVALFWWVLPKYEDSTVGYVRTFAFVFVSPVLLAFVTYGVRNARRLRGLLLRPDPTAWDFHFRRRNPCWVLCHLKSGKKIGGYYGLNSLASGYPHPQDLYIEQVWRLDEYGRFVEPILQSAGALIRHEECALIELFRAEGPEDVGPFVVYNREGRIIHGG